MNKTNYENLRFLEKNFFDFVTQEKENAQQWKDFICDNLDINSNNATSHTVTNNNIDFLVIQIAKFFRKFGYLMANLNPLDQSKWSNIDWNQKIIKDFNLDINSLELINQDQNSIYFKKNLKQIIENLSQKYLNTSSAEFEHLMDEERYEWLVKNYENSQFTIDNEQRNLIAKSLMHTEMFEQFIHVKFPSAKRFSIEGGEAAIIFFEQFLNKSAELKVSEVCLGMAHRGRLNFLTKICGESYGSILGQFSGKNYLDQELNASGDVKYHLGKSSICQLNNGNNIGVSLMPNPSHLESVNGIVLGLVRAKQDQINFLSDNQNAKKQIIPFLIHGDASFVGQGVVYECLAMNNLDGYDVGGCIHLIIDNQVGFTADAKETRPSKYASEMAKTLNIPIFHINGDDPESAVFIADLCARYRNEFNGDIVINLVCYRRFGHNEGDEPNFTQPVLYKAISNHKNPYQIYKELLINKYHFSEKEFLQSESEFKEFLQQESNNFQAKNKDDLINDEWKNHELTFDDKNSAIIKNTALSQETIDELLKILKNTNNKLIVNEKLKKLVLDARIKMLESPKESIDWGCAEMLAFASILRNGKNIRISGEDVVRGTFAHRHAAFTDQNTGEKHFYYQEIATNNAQLKVFNSFLSEYAVMGFDYGYSTFKPNQLVIWEAQFGDFANGAQIIIDQYISGAEQKWLQASNLVLMLPHGYEGQGPEHSSARIERFLQLAAQFNMRIVQPTTPANLFHALRMQVADQAEFKKPLIIFTPKSLLRHRLVRSTHQEFLEESYFKPVIFESNIMQKIDQINKIILCSGKIYYELLEKLQSQENTNILLIRIEQLYPFPSEEIKQILQKFKLNNIKLIWAQDEPQNMGAYQYCMLKIAEILLSIDQSINPFNSIHYAGRPASASVATGSQYTHNKEQAKIIESCLSD